MEDKDAAKKALVMAIGPKPKTESGPEESMEEDGDDDISALKADLAKALDGNKKAAQKICDIVEYYMSQG